MPTWASGSSSRRDSSPPRAPLEVAVVVVEGFVQLPAARFIERLGGRVRLLRGEQQALGDRGAREILGGGQQGAAERRRVGGPPPRTESFRIQRRFIDVEENDG